MQSETRKEVFTERMSSNRRIYYFDVKESKDGVRYLVISETELGKVEHHRVMVFEESMEAFMDGLQRAANFVSKQITKPEKLNDITGQEKAYSVEVVRKEFPNAYAKWSAIDDDLLKTKYAEGIEISDLAKLLNRKVGAIQSRLKKLGLLIPTYGE
jgi:hypothetical protein